MVTVLFVKDCIWNFAAAGDSITDDEWDAAYIYLVFVFRKVVYSCDLLHGSGTPGESV